MKYVKNGLFQPCCLKIFWLANQKIWSNLEKLARNIYNFEVINNGIEKVMDGLKLEEGQDIDINRQKNLPYFAPSGTSTS